MNAAPKISYRLDGMTYYDNSQTLGAFCIFQDIEKWRQEPHTVSICASPMKSKKNLFAPPVAKLWELNATVKTTTLGRTPNTVGLFNNMTESEALVFMQAFQQETSRTVNFNHAHFGKDYHQHDQPQEIKFRSNIPNPLDPINQYSLQLQKDNRFHYPYLMMTEQVFASSEYQRKQKNIFHQNEVAPEQKAYRPWDSVNYDSLFRGLNQETIQLITDGMKESLYPVQLVAMHRRNELFYNPGWQNIAVSSKNDTGIYSENTWDIMLKDSGEDELIPLLNTAQFSTAYQILDNFTQGLFKPLLQQVSAHQAISKNYNCLYSNWKNNTQLIDRVNQHCGLS